MSEKKFFSPDQKSTHRHKLVNALNYDYRSVRNERNTLPSLTIPDQTMSVKQILDRYARGLPLEGVKVPLYDEENDLPDPRTLDLAERQEFAESFREEIATIRERTKKQDTPPDTPAPTTPPTPPEQPSAA